MIDGHVYDVKSMMGYVIINFRYTVNGAVIQ